MSTYKSGQKEWSKSPNLKCLDKWKTSNLKQLRSQDPHKATINTGCHKITRQRTVLLEGVTQLFLREINECKENIEAWDSNPTEELNREMKTNFGDQNKIIALKSTQEIELKAW